MVSKKKSITSVRKGLEKSVPCHHVPSLVMPNGDPRD